MRRPVRLVPLLALALVLAATARAAAPPSWAAPQIRTVVSHGLMAPDVASFRPDAPLTAEALADLAAGLTDTVPQPVAKPGARVTMVALDAKLVRALGLGPAATSFLRGARDAGLAPPARFGTEAAARLLGLRFNHPAARDDLELLPNDTATRAEAAYSAARVLGFGGSEVDRVSEAAETFVLPALSLWQKRILSTAFSLIGYPYVWGGTSERAEAPFGVRARGGFDCSGFVWRVYKLQSYAGGTELADTLRGRTTFAMSGEVPRAKRIPFAKLQPGDVVFFGLGGPRSAPAQISHSGIYVGSGWFVHSSSQGVALSTLSGWYRDRFAWARRPLAEAGLLTPLSRS